MLILVAALIAFSPPADQTDACTPTVRLEEDQAPASGIYGGTLIDFSSGTAIYADQTSFDGCWSSHPA